MKIDIPAHAREQAFHDEWASDIDPRQVLVDESFNGSTSPEGVWISKMLGDVAGKKLLDLGAGAGEASVWFAKRGAKVTATDLSPGMLKVINQVADIHGVELKTIVTSADDLSIFPDESFDIVYGANLLHHVDIEVCLAEVKRVLKPDGVAAFWDPVAHNPIINIYRLMASEVRTEDEHPIRRSDIKKFRIFPEVSYKFFWLTSLLVFLKFFLIDRIHPNKDRYWKRIIKRESELRTIVVPLMSIDRILLKIIPILGWWCWNIAIIVRK